jgi:CheY-like chemotaxis protein
MPTVLVVDDDADLCAMLSVFLGWNGIDVVTASNGREALDWLTTHHPAVILLDLMMPVMDGAAFREYQLRLPDLRDIPVVCLSAHHNGRCIAHDLGLTEFLSKPFELETVVRTVRRYCPAQPAAVGGHGAGAARGR